MKNVFRNRDWQHARNAAKSATEHADLWAESHPYQAAVAGAALGLVTSVAINKILAIKGAVAAASCVYGVAKGAATGFAYPLARKHAGNLWRTVVQFNG